jgi:hypothetical protein
MAIPYFTGLVRSRSNVGNTSQRLRAYPIQNGAQSAMYTGTPVKLSNGTVDVATNTAAVLGVACGFAWIDKTTGQPQYSGFFPAATSSKNSGYLEGYNSPFALVDDNPHGTWIITSDLSVSAGNVGTLARVTNGGAGSTTTKRSSCELDVAGTAVSAGNAMFRIVGLYNIEEAAVSTAGANAVVGDFRNAYDSPTTILEVVFQNHLYG